MHVVQKCANCSAEARCRRRDFSAQVWSVLLLWEEVERESVDQPICNDCYQDLREILIERGDEMEEVLRSGTIPDLGGDEGQEKKAEPKKASSSKSTKTASAKKSRKVKIA